MSLSRNEIGGETSMIKLNVVDMQRRRTSRNFGDDDHRPSFFHPQPELADPTPNGIRNYSISSNKSVEEAEKKLTLFALRLAILEKAATRLGTIAFVWATVVLLGGFAITLEKTDFWYVTVILFVESNRILFRSHQLEWQHEVTWTLTKSLVGKSFRALMSSSNVVYRVLKNIFHPFRKDNEDIPRMNAENSSEAIGNTKERTWNTANIPLLPYIGWAFMSKNVSKVLSLLQVVAAFACVALSLIRLIKHDFGEVAQESRNRGAALILFYSLALAEALLFLVEKAYWIWRINTQKLLLNVSKECELGESGVESITRFFYDTYSKCIEGSIFDGVKMDLVTFAKELLNSEFRSEQLMGVRMLQKFVTSERFAYDALRKIGTSGWVMERLIEMLSWKNLSDGEIRICAAEIVSKLSGKKQNALRVAAIPGALESISSLLYTVRNPSNTPYEIPDRSIIMDQTDYEFYTFNLFGLLILKKLANDHDNCGKIGSTRGLLSKVIDLTSVNKILLWNERAPDSQIKAIKRSLQVLKKLVSTTGNTGKTLRREIAENVFTVSNIRDVLQYGQSHMVLQKLGIDILTALGTDEYAKEHIGRTGGVIKLLSKIFFKPGFTDDEKMLSNEAGEALALLALESKNNCHSILMLPAVLQNLTDAIENEDLQVNALRILRSLCAYSDTNSSDRLCNVVVTLPTVLKLVMVTKGKSLEMSIGLITQICKLINTSEFAEGLGQSGFEEINFAERLIQILKEYHYPDLEVPRMRRFVIEQVIWMMRYDKSNIEVFKSFEVEKLLDTVSETTSELECYHIFSGSVGLSRHSKIVSSLVEEALELLKEPESINK